MDLKKLNKIAIRNKNVLISPRVYLNEESGIIYLHHDGWRKQLGWTAAEAERELRETIRCHRMTDREYAEYIKE